MFSGRCLMRGVCAGVFFAASVLSSVFPALAAEAVTSQAAKPVCLLVSTLQEPEVLASRERIDALIACAKQAKVDTLFVQVYRGNQSWFPSKIADETPFKRCKTAVGEDAFALLITKAHAEGIKVFSWMNMLSMSKNADAPLLKRYGPSVLTVNRDPKKTLDDYLIDNQFFLEPGDARVRKALNGIVAELAAAYPALDGMLFDYIRYPDVHPFYGWGNVNLARFKAATGIETFEESDLLWKNWKRDQVSGLVRQLVQTAKQARPGITIATAVCVSYARAYHEALQDWPSWVNTGLVDFVTLMNYPEDPVKYKRYLNEAKGKVTDPTRIHPAVGAYKLLSRPEVFAQEFASARDFPGGPIVVYHYGCMLESAEISRIVSAAAAQ
jgi:uncharacterized lipoprotein YddW (UPF0748 family)